MFLFNGIWYEENMDGFTQAVKSVSGELGDVLDGLCPNDNNEYGTGYFISNLMTDEDLFGDLERLTYELSEERRLAQLTRGDLRQKESECAGLLERIGDLEQKNMELAKKIDELLEELEERS